MVGFGARSGEGRAPGTAAGAIGGLYSKGPGRGGGRAPRGAEGPVGRRRGDRAEGSQRTEGTRQRAKGTSQSRRGSKRRPFERTSADRPAGLLLLPPGAPDSTLPSAF